LVERHNNFTRAAAVDEAFGVEIGKLLDQFDAKCRAVEDRKRRVKADQDDFDRDFARIIATIVKPLFLSVGALLTERGHLVTISEEEPVAESGAKPTETGISIRITPGSGTQPEQVPWLAVVTRQYNKTVSIRSGNVGSAAAGATGPHGDYPPSQFDARLIEGELLKFIGAVVAGAGS
jgi:hypothetical protein